MCANNDSKNKQNIDNVTCHRYEFQKKHYVVILYRNKPDWIQNIANYIYFYQTVKSFF